MSATRIPADAAAVQRLTSEFLADKPLFGAVADKFLSFVGDAPLVAHDTGFDIAFLNAELRPPGRGCHKLGKPESKPSDDYSSWSRNPSLIPISISERDHATSRREANPTIRHPMCRNELATEVKLPRDHD